MLITWQKARDHSSKLCSVVTNKIVLISLSKVKLLSQFQYLKVKLFLGHTLWQEKVITIFKVMIITKLRFCTVLFPHSVCIKAHIEAH